MPKSPLKNDRIYLRINKDLKKRAENVAQDMDITLSELVTRFLNKLVAREEKNEETPS